MKFAIILFGAVLTAYVATAQVTLNADTGKKQESKKISIAVEQEPTFPGGYTAFSKYLSKNVRYPDVARLIGINGRVVVTFIVERDGSVSHATPVRCIGAGCESAAVNVVELSPKWKPGIQNGKLVRVAYAVPINFNIDMGKVTMKTLRKSDYGFIFNIKGVLYTIDEAEAIIGKSFMSDQVQIAEPFFNYNNVAKFEMPDKKEVYLIILKSS